MKTINDRLLFFKSSRLNRFFFSLLGIGFDSTADKSLSVILFVSSITLSIASGYTTITGINEYVPMVVAALIGFGIQGLLLTSSWKIGSMLFEEKKKKSLVIIYGISFLSSVFFSYSALLDFIYLPADRKIDEFDRSKTVCINVQTSSLEFLEQRVNNETAKVVSDLEYWNESLSQFLIVALDSVREEYNIRSTKYNRLRNRYEREIGTGITPVIINSDTIYTPPGFGDYAKKYQNEMQQFYFDSLYQIEQWVKNFNQINSNLRSSVDSLFANTRLVTGRSLVVVRNNQNSLFELIRDITTDSIPTLNIEEFNPRLIDESRSFYDWLNTAFSLETPSNLYQLKEVMNEYLSRLSRTGINIGSYQSEVGSIGKYGGENVHHFVLAIGSIMYGLPIAFGSLIMALVIDVLILFCGILGAKPESFLKMRKAEDLDKVQELALEIVFAVNPASSSNSANKFEAQVANFLQLIKPNIETATQGYPGYVILDDIKSNDLIKEVGTLISMKLARRTKDNSKVMISTRLLLWLSEQIINSKLNKQEFDELNKILS